MHEKLQKQKMTNSIQNAKRPVGFTTETSANESSGGKIKTQSRFSSDNVHLIHAG